MNFRNVLLDDLFAAMIDLMKDSLCWSFLSMGKQVTTCSAFDLKWMVLIEDQILFLVNFCFSIQGLHFKLEFPN
jgi:hypothetical protein